MPLLHLLSKTTPGTPVYFIDTGYHFPETLEFRDRVVREWNLNLIVVRPDPVDAPAVSGDRAPLYRTNPQQCCRRNKVEPIERVLRHLDCWISGVRRDQTERRSTLRVVEPGAAGTTRVHPLANWTDVDVRRYAMKNQLPSHPLEAAGYASVGCAPCTRPVRIGDAPRSGRWSGTGKTECGLHTRLRPASNGESGE